MIPANKEIYLKHGWKDEVGLIERWTRQHEYRDDSYTRGLKQAALDLEANLAERLMRKMRYES